MDDPHSYTHLGIHYGIDTRIAVHGTVETLERACYGNKGERHHEYPGLVWVRRAVISLTYSSRRHGFSACFGGSTGWYPVGNVRNVEWGEPLTLKGYAL